MTQRIVINRCARGSLLSPAGLQEFIRRKYAGTPPVDFTPDAIERTDPVLLTMMQENVRLYAGHCAHIKIVTLEDGFAWQLKRSGNSEWIAPA